ncbi:MAG: hypothetical protein ACOH2F_00035 [Cellulomonas sp.]
MVSNTTSRTAPVTTLTRRLTQGAVGGALAGMAASLVMAMFAMIAAATYQNSGFFTPLYHIASTFISPDTMMASMQQAMDGATFYFVFGPAVVGALVHMMIGAMYGAMFAIAAVLLRLRGPILIPAGAVWGAMVFVISSFAALPIAAAVFSSGDQIAQMAAKVGYGTFLTEHLLFGLALGMLLAAWRPFARR